MGNIIKKWKPIHLCWLFRRLGLPIPPYLIGGGSPFALSGSRIANATRVWQANEDVSITDWNKSNNLIFAVAFESGAHAAAEGTIGLRVRNKTDGGSFVDIDAGEELVSAGPGGTDLVEGNPITSDERGCSGSGTWVDGIENDGISTGSCIPTALGKAQWSEHQWAVNCSNAHDGDEYEFELFDTTEWISVGTCLATITMAGGVTHYGSATLSGVGTLSGIGVLILNGLATLVGSGLLSAIGVRIYAGKVSLTGTGILDALGRLIKYGVTTLSGIGSLSAIGEVFKLGVATLSGIGNLVTSAVTILIGKTTLTGTGSLSSKGIVTVIGKAILSGIGELSAIGTVIGEGIIHYGAVVLSGIGNLTVSAVSSLIGNPATLSGGGGIAQPFPHNPNRREVLPDMPYPNNHACLINPELTKVLGSQTRLHKGKKYLVRIARAEGKTKGSGERSYLYPIKDWTKKEAREHCKEAKGEFHPATKKVEHFILGFFNRENK